MSKKENLKNEWSMLKQCRTCKNYAFIDKLDWDGYCIKKDKIVMGGRKPCKEFEWRKYDD